MKEKTIIINSNRPTDLSSLNNIATEIANKCSYVSEIGETAYILSFNNGYLSLIRLRNPSFLIFVVFMQVSKMFVGTYYSGATLTFKEV